MHRLKFTLTLLTIIVLNSHSYSQTTNCTISGVVKDSVTGQSVIGASVVIYTDTNFTNSPFRGAITNDMVFIQFQRFLKVIIISLLEVLDIKQSQKRLRLNQTKNL